MSNSKAVNSAIDTIQRVGFLLLIIGAIASAIGFMAGRQALMQSYLFGWVFWVCLTIGCFGFTLLHHTVRSHWGVPLIRLFEAGGGPVNLALMAVLYAPILLFSADLYPWARPEEVAQQNALQHRAQWMNPSAIGLRTYLLYFGLWILVAYMLRRWSLLQDKTGDTKLAQLRSTFAAGSAVFFFLTVTLAFTDWVMSLDTHWYSTIYGVWFVVGSGLLTLACTSVFIISLRKHAPYDGVVNAGTIKDLNNWTLTFTMFWAYTSISQFMIIWSGNLPEEITYYITRNSMPWLPIGTILIFGQFFLPFLCLLAPRTKHVPTLLRTLAVWIIVMRFVDVSWIVLPAMKPRAGGLWQWTDFAAFLFVGGLWLASFATQMKSAPLLPERNLGEAEGESHA